MGKAYRLIGVVDAQKAGHFHQVSSPEIHRRNSRIRNIDGFEAHAFKLLLDGLDSPAMCSVENHLRCGAVKRQDVSTCRLVAEVGVVVLHKGACQGVWVHDFYGGISI